MRCRCASRTPSARRLQLINFWQDLSVDLPRGRVYVPLADLQRHGLDLDQLLRQADDDAMRALVRDLAHWAAALMARARRWPCACPGASAGNCGWWSRADCGFLRKSRAMDFASVRTRPVLGRKDALPPAVARLRMQ